MPILRMLPGGTEAGAHNGEVFSCVFSPDGQFVLSGGWDGQLRLWEGITGAPLSVLHASDKALSACAITPDGRQWLSGSLEGMLAGWDPASHRQVSLLMAHTRPISSIVFSPDRMTLATASWDRSITIWSHLQEREGRTLLGHQDIVAGCRFTPEGNRLLSWSHDGTVRVWDPTSGLCLSVLKGHRDRVTAAAISPDGSLAASGSRDQALKLWNLAQFSEERSVRLEAEIRGCFFLLDGESLMTADARGQLQLFTLPDLQPGGELLTRLPVQCGDLSPQGQTLAVGCGDGRVRLVAVEGLDGAPLLVMPTRTTRQVQNRLERLFGRRRLVHAYSCTCPRCRQSFEVSGSSLGQAADCPNCQRPIRVSPVARLQNEN